MLSASRFIIALIMLLGVLVFAESCLRKHAVDDEFEGGAVKEDCNGFDRSGSKLAAEFSVKCIELGVQKDEDIVYHCGQQAKEMFCHRELLVYSGNVSKPCRLTVGKARETCLAGGWSPALATERKDSDTTLPSVIR